MLYTDFPCRRERCDHFIPEDVMTPRNEESEGNYLSLVGGSCTVQ